MDNKKIEKKKKEKENAAAVAAASLLDRCEPYGPDVVTAMQKFLQMRTELKKPLKSKQAATMLWNNLLHLSYGDPAWMAKLLDKANEHQWLTVYQLKDDELPKTTPAAAKAESSVVDTRGLRFV